MTRALQIAHLAVLLAVVGTLGFLSWRVNKTLNRVDDAESKGIAYLSATFEQINRPCGTSKPCGTLADVNRTLATFRGAAGQVEVAARHENKNLDALDKQERTLFLDAHKTLLAASQTLHGASLTLSTMNDSIAAAKPLLEASTATVQHFDAAAPAVTATAANIQKMTSDGARITKDAADEVDKLAHPAKKKLGFWGGFWVGMQYVHKMMPSIF